MIDPIDALTWVNHEAKKCELKARIRTDGTHRAWWKLSKLYYAIKDIAAADLLRLDLLLPWRTVIMSGTPFLVVVVGTAPSGIRYFHLRLDRFRWALDLPRWQGPYEFHPVPTFDEELMDSAAVEVLLSLNVVAANLGSSKVDNMVL